MAKKQSPALHLISHVWEHNREATGHSWQRLNASMHEAVNLAITGGLSFNVDDFKFIAEHYRIGYWGGNNGNMCGESFYSLAIKYGHASAWQSFEAWKQRKPFIISGQRMCVGAKASWYGRTVDCTSIDAERIICCEYKWDDKLENHKLVKRHAITHDDIREFTKARKAEFRANKALAAV